MSRFFSDLNESLGAVQVDNYSGYVASLPVVEASLYMYSNSIDLEAKQAMVHNVRKFEQLPLDSLSSTPISRRHINDDRITTVQGETIPVKTNHYGVSIIIDNVYEANTKENVISSSTKLFADWGSRLRETLLFNMLRGAGIQYTFSKGGTAGNTSQANLTDLVLAKSILDKNRVRRSIMTMHKGSEQIGTHPVGQSFTGHVSVGGRASWELAIADAVDIVRPYEVPFISDYLYQNIFYVKKADTCLYSSTEITDNEHDRIMILHGHESYLTVGKSPVGSAVIFDPEYKAAFGMHTKISYRMAHGQAIVRNDPIVNCRYTDNAPTTASPTNKP